ncbi:MAG: tetratricopeptide repeat protein, partial [Alphaproteobacteria bacterium]|nr:tetratricopeptide repeat protein [Alphaproteobacteria bacterium]
PLFARAGALRKLGRWQDAEADLVSALEIAPDRPELLNFLGYAWVERGIKIEDGLGLIEQAMANEPDAGYIVDSLGWAHYRLGAYEEAVQILERAAELTPSDPVIADHLGDAYWRIGRVIEAGYAWRNGLTLKPEAPLEASLRTKMASGLSATGATMTADGQAIP